MKQAIIRSTWMDGYGYRLDCQPYLGGALEMKVLLERLPLRKDKLHTLTTGFDGGIYNGPKFSRTWVESPKHGVPFVGSSSMLYADLSDLPLLSKKQAYGRQLSHLELQPGMSLISCSGTIGKMVYTRRDMAGIWSSQHILKVVPDPAKIPSGYLYAYLSSRFGVPLIVSGTYGSIIQSLGPNNISDVPVPRLSDSLEHEIHSLVEEAAELRTRATLAIEEAKRILLEEAGLPPLFCCRLAGNIVSEATSRTVIDSRPLDPWFYNAKAIATERWVRQHFWGAQNLGELTEVFGTSPFKRVYVEDEIHGVGFFGSADIFKLDRKPEQYLSRSETKNIQSYVLPKRWRATCFIRFAWRCDCATSICGFGTRRPNCIQPCRKNCGAF